MLYNFSMEFFLIFLNYLTLNVCLCNIEFESELQCRFAFNFISGRNFMLKWFMLTVYITLCCYVMWSFCRWTKKIYLPKRRAFNIIVCGLILIFAASIFLGIWRGNPRPFNDRDESAACFYHAINLPKA